MSIRISGGSLKGRLIGSPHPAKGVRPTTERVKLAIFSILGDYRVQYTNVLDFITFDIYLNKNDFICGIIL